MPNLQQWLNAWVKVNNKQNITATPSATTHGHSANHRTSRANPTKTLSNGAVSSSQSTSMAIKGKNLDRAATASEPERPGKLDPLIAVVVGTSQLGLMDPLSSNGHGSLDATIATSTEPLGNDDLEHAAIRKFTNRKHKRRLQRTNSFSDLIREEARHRVDRSNGRHMSVERPNYPGSGGAREYRRKSYNYNPGHHLLYPPKAFPPPPTLHHSFVAPEQSLEVASSNLSSAHSVSPAETASTVQQSNMFHRSYSDGGPYNEIDHSNSALLGVAEFFGTELEEQEVRTASNAPQHQTHVAHHGSEDEQPSYVQAHLFHSRRQAAINSSSRPSTALYNNTNTTDPTRLHHPQYNIHTRHPIQHNLISPRSSNPVNQPLPPYRRSQTAPSSSSSVPGTRTKPPTVDHPTRRQNEDVESGLMLAGVRLPFFSKNQSVEAATRPPPTGDENNHTNSDPNPFGVGEPNCKGCHIAQAELQCAQESLEYMRTMAIRKEYTCSKCNSSNTAQNLDSSTRKNANASPTVKSSSKQLSEVTARHKKQVEQLLKERNHWQRKMHMKLDKFANLSRNLNDESSFRVEESKSLKEELKEVKTERDRMAAELEQLRTAVQLHEKEREEHRRIQEKIAMYESGGLHQAEQAIAVRDDMIAKLTVRLGATLDTLALEREQLRQRRQIIFPPTSSNGRSSHYQMNGQSMNIQSLNRNDKPRAQATINQATSQKNSSTDEEIQRLRSQLLQSQRLLYLTQKEAQQKETELLLRCDTLEKQLEQSVPGGPKKKSPPKERHHLSEQSEEDFS